MQYYSRPRIPDRPTVARSDSLSVEIERHGSLGRFTRRWAFLPSAAYYALGADGWIRRRWTWRPDDFASAFERARGKGRKLGYSRSMIIGNYPRRKFSSGSLLVLRRNYRDDCTLRFIILIIVEFATPKSAPSIKVINIYLWWCA